MLPLEIKIAMFEEYEKKKKRNVSLMRSILDYGVGSVIVLFGAFMFFRNNWELAINERFKPDIMDKILGGICMAYGLWRIYRGYKKNYFR